MKRALKRILPILLGIVVIASIVWYLFVYDRDFTRDMLLTQARFFEGQGNHTVAAWLYDQAYRQSEDNESVAIELAEQFKAAGNYTKAEYTLSNAIADGGSAELYIALCKTYVEQDKLLDAVTMLDNITDAAVKEQLDAIRPKAPAVSHDPGFYSQYITVTLSCEGGTLYTTTDGTYPSTENGAGTGEITLVGGENTIYALVLGDNGLVSPLAIYGYTVGGVIEPAIFTEPAMESYVRQLLNVDDSYTILTDANRLQQVLINYLTNAEKHTDRGEIHLHCSLTENPGKLTFSVTDTGCGIPESEREHIFERFKKLDLFKQGTGLGLNICRIIAMRLNAEAKLDVNYHQGARFLFILPIPKEDEVASSPENNKSITK